MILYKLYLFDYDGTLADTNEIVNLSLITAVKRCLNKDITKTQLIPILGKVIEDQMAYFCKEKTQELVECYKECYRNNQDKMTRLFPGAVETISQLKSRGSKLGIVSSKGRRGINHGLNMFNIAHMFDIIVAAREVQFSKPHPQPILKALEQAAVKPEEAVMIGDSPHDILSGKRAGVKTVAVSWTQFPMEQIKELNPDFIIDRMEDILEL